VGITLDQPITSVEAKGNALVLTLADGATRTFIKDKETGVWQEQVSYRSFKELNPANEADLETLVSQYRQDVAGGMFASQEEVVQWFTDSGWRAYEDEGSHSVVLVPPEIATRLDEQYGGNFSASPWAKIIADQREKGTISGGMKLKTDSYTVAGFDAQGNPVLYVSLAEFNPVGKDFMGVILTEGDRIEVKPASDTPFRKFIVRWDMTFNNWSLVDENERTTHVWDKENKQWQELDEYLTYGTPTQRVAQALYYEVFEKRIRANSRWYENVLGLDKEEVVRFIQLVLGRPNWQPRDDFSLDEEKALPWQEALKQAGVKSFMILPDKFVLNDKGLPALDAEGMAQPAKDAGPAMIVVTDVNNPNGLKPETIKALYRNAAILSAVDPEILRFLTDQFGAKVITGETDVLKFKRNDKGEIIDERSNTNDNQSVIGTNQDRLLSGVYKDLLDAIWALSFMGESGELHEADHQVAGKSGWVMAGNLEGKFFGQFTFGEWLPAWLQKNKDSFYDRGLVKYHQHMIMLASHQLERYKQASQK